MPNAVFDIIPVYDICTRIDASRYQDGITKLPIFFKHRVVVCGECEVVGKGEHFYVDRTKLIVRDNFILCGACATKRMPQDTRNRRNNVRCNVCSGSNKTFVTESKAYITGNPKDTGVVHVCYYCAEQGRYDNSYQQCGLCQKFHPPSRLNNAICGDCSGSLYDCRKCGKQHLRSTHQKVKWVQNMNHMPDSIEIFCSKKLIYGMDVSKLIHNDYSNVIAKRNKKRAKVK